MKKMMEDSLGTDVDVQASTEPHSKAKPKRKLSLNSEIEQMKELMKETLGEETQTTNMIPSSMTHKKQNLKKKPLHDSSKAEKESETKRKKLMKERGNKGIFFGEDLENSYQLCEVFILFYFFFYFLIYLKICIFFEVRYQTTFSFLFIFFLFLFSLNHFPPPLKGISNTTRRRPMYRISQHLWT